MKVVLAVLWILALVGWTLVAIDVIRGLVWRDNGARRGDPSGPRRG